MKKFPLADATRHVSLLAQLLDFKFTLPVFNFNTWETVKVKYEKQTGTELPDSVLVATLLNKTAGPLQQHLRLNARTLTTSEEIRATTLEYPHSRHMLTVPPLRRKVQHRWTLQDLKATKVSAKVVSFT